MTTITTLSNELIEIILQLENISIKDVVSFGLTCRRFLAEVDDNNPLWQRKFYQRWPHLKKLYDQRIQSHEDINFKDDIKASIKCRNELRRYLSLMSDMFFCYDELADVDLMDSDLLFWPNKGAYTMNYCFLVDELIYLIEMTPGLSNCNLTHQYYSKKLLPYIHQRHLKDVWQTFMNFPKEQQLLELVAIIVARWYQPLKRFFTSEVETSLDNIAQQVLEDLKNAHCDHPIFSTSAKQFSFWKYNINDNQWSRKDEEQIINVLRTVLFDKLHFRGPPVLESNELLDPKAEYFLIDCVLETKVGNAMSLAIIFQSVARRLGVRCDLVCFPTHFFLSWKPKYDTENPKEEYFYIDILHGGLIRSRDDCPRIRGRRCPIESFNKHNEISPTELVLRMINSLQTVKPNYHHHHDRALQMRSLVEFRYMVEPHNIDAIENLCRHYTQYDISVSGLITTLERLLSAYNDRTSVEASRIRMLLKALQYQNETLRISRDYLGVTIPKTERPKEIKYAVGMTVKCKENICCCAGVIIWWDEEHDSKYEILKILHERRMALHNHIQPPHSSDSISLKQPFYVILNESGNTYYAAQETLVKAHPPKWIGHNEIGRYFCGFVKSSHYVPNDTLTRYFPHDIEILNAPHLPPSFYRQVASILFN
ncbi:F-box only protein 21-like [Temnothorax curvispinosus]|uniref:F-box only protein 21-like n=1 Tax=Temnothorax curvispinosus TaxID=300111 RepID=A0A6J1QZC8_9HYME|nr:F-box only protein 21-like [Temnothorax curvispinosus]